MRGVHREAAWGWRWRRPATGRAAPCVGGGGSGVAVLQVGVGGAADQADAGRVGVSGVEREAGHVVMAMSGGG